MTRCQAESRAARSQTSRASWKTLWGKCKSSRWLGKGTRIGSQPLARASSSTPSLRRMPLFCKTRGAPTLADVRVLHVQAHLAAGFGRLARVVEARLRGVAAMRLQGG